jgi:DNA-binding NarL/FixJ family response regulator
VNEAMGKSIQQPCRIILANKPRLLRGMLKRVLQKVPDFQVVGEVLDPARLSATIEKTEAQWVVLSLSPTGKMPAMAETLLAVHPTICILAVAMDGSRVKVKWVEPHEQDLNGLLLEELLAIMRSQHH